MKIALLHNSYQQHGGEDSVFAAELDLLRSRDHEVFVFKISNSDLQLERLRVRAKVGLQTVWNRSSNRKIKELLSRFRPDVAHLHNFFPLISPSAYSVLRELNVPVVQTLHNYRLICPQPGLFRDGGPCEDCVGRTIPWPGVAHGCYRGSRIATLPVALMLSTHNFLGTWHKQVDAFIVPSQFSRDKLCDGGLPQEKIYVKPHFVSMDPGQRIEQGKYALYVGRIAEEKGIHPLLSAWESIMDLPLVIAGDGPLSDVVARSADSHPGKGIKFLGRVPEPLVNALLAEALFLIVPSLCYETFGRVIIEAFACGVPVLASRIGALEELVTDMHTGLHVEAGNARDLASKVTWALEHPDELRHMGGSARTKYEEKYTADHNYEILMTIYDRVRSQR